jgi:hypothetical protein
VGSVAVVGKLLSDPWADRDKSLAFSESTSHVLVVHHGLTPHAHLDRTVMHRASTRYTKRSSSAKARQGPGQLQDGLQVGEGGDLRRKILQRTHSTASRSTSNSSATTTSSSKSRSPGLESCMPAFMTAPRRSPSSVSSSPSSGYSPSPLSAPLSAFENYHRYSLYPMSKQVLAPPATGPKDREDVDITDYYSESIRKRGLYATPFGDLPNSNPPSPSSPPPPPISKREGTDSVKDLDFGLQILLARQFLGTNVVPGIQHGQDRNALNPTFGSALVMSRAPLDGDIGEGVPMDSDSDRRRGVSFNTSVGDRDAGASDHVSVDGFDIGSDLSTTTVQLRPGDAVKLSRNVVGEQFSPADRSADNGDIANGAKSMLDSPCEADICDVELTSLSPRVGCENTFMNIMPPHAFDAFTPNRPPPCRIRAVSQLPASVF